MKQNKFVIRANGLALAFFHSKETPVKFLDQTFSPIKEDSVKRMAYLVEIQATGFNQNDFHGNKYTKTSPAADLRYASHRVEKNSIGTKIEITQKVEGLKVTSHFQFLGKLPAYRSWTEVENTSSKEFILEYVSSFSLGEISRGGKKGWNDKMILHLPHNDWIGECQWRSAKPGDFGLKPFYLQDRPKSNGLDRISISNVGTWSTMGYLPLGVMENVENGDTYFWQIEHNGSWHWEIADTSGELYLKASGPTYNECHWSKKLRPKKSFESVPVTVGHLKGNAQDAFRTLTQVRRIIRRPHSDMEQLPIIFNDFMNCLWGNPTEENLPPVIQKAAEIGCEYFVIDAGWYASRSGAWSNTIGEWQPSKDRFPTLGLKGIIDLIHKTGMIPGLWLELEAMGVSCPLVQKVSPSWFFQRNGIPVCNNNRYQLDFRNPEVRAFADGVIDRLIKDYHIGYIKMDYNFNAGAGTDCNADSVGDGLLEHNRTYLKWLEAVMDRYPTLVIENCSSGGMRLDYAQLSRHSVQSVSDQTDYRVNAVIAASCPSALTPEQAAIWSYPIKDGDEEETIFNMVNSMLLRVHQSGRLEQLSTKRLSLVKEGLDIYKKIRRDFPKALPFWALGIPQLEDGWISLGLDCGKKSYLAVWRLNGSNKTQTITLPSWINKKSEVECIYPQSKKTTFKWSDKKGLLEVTLPRPYTARLFCVSKA